MHKSYLFILFITACVLSGFSQPTYQWSKSFGSSTTSETGQSIAVDPSGDVYVAGIFTGTMDFDPSPSVFSLSSSGGNDIYIAKYSSIGNFIWAIKIGGTSDEKALDIFADATGVYIAGSFVGTVDFDPTSGVSNIVSLGGGTDGDGYFAKYSPAGALVWKNRIGSTVNDRITSIVVDNAQNAYVGGFIGGNADMDPGTGVVTFSVSSTFNAFFGKYSPTGAYLFAKQITGGYSEGDDINIDASNNIYFTGAFSLTNDFDPGSGTANFSTSSLTQSDIFLAKYSPTGTYIYAKQIGSNGIDIGLQVVPDALGNVYLGGTFSNACDFDPTASTFTVASAGSSDLFVSKYSSTGTLVWVNNTGGTATDYVYGMGVDATNNVYITGKFQGTAIDFDPSVSTTTLTGTSNTMYLAGYNSTGSILFAKSIGDVFSEGKGLWVNSSLYVTGFFSTTADFDFSASSATLTSTGGNDAFFAKYNLCSGLPPNQPSAISGNTVFCAGSTQIFSVVNDVLATSYSWVLPSGSTGTSTSNTISVLTGSLSGSIIVTANNSCGISLTQSLAVTINPLPIVNVSSSNSLICVGQTATLTALGALTYTWSTTSTSSNIAVSPVITTTYSVIGINSNGCSNTSTFTQSVSVCTELITINNEDNLFTIYPNPSKDIFFMDLKIPVKINVIDMFGREIFEAKFNEGSHQLNLSNYDNGLYLIVAETDNFIQIIKLLKN